MGVLYWSSVAVVVVAVVVVVMVAFQTIESWIVPD